MLCDTALYPYLGSKPVAAISAQGVLGALRRIEARGRHETAHRVRAMERITLQDMQQWQHDPVGSPAVFRLNDLVFGR